MSKPDIDTQFPTWKGKDGIWHNDRLPTVDDVVPAPQPSHTSKELDKDIMAIPNKLADQITTLENKYHHNEISFDRYIEMGEYYMDEASRAIRQREKALLKKVSELYGISLPELENNLAHYKLEDK